MDGVHTRGQPTALAAVGAMVAGDPPHAVLLSGPGGVGKTTLAMDLAAGLLCDAPDRAERPCGACRSCRMVAHGNHPDVHRLVPEGAGRQIVIGGGDGRSRGVRDLVGELSLLPVEGGARVAIVEEAHRMNEDAQSALLKTLEEPPAGVTIVLCADEEERLLPTVRSRCARIRLGPVAARDIEAILADLGVADPPTAARLGRLAHGRPGVALAYALAPDAVTIRAEVVRSLLDLIDARAGERLAGLRAVLGRAADLGASLDAAAKRTDREATDPPTGRGRGRGKTGGGASRSTTNDAATRATSIAAATTRASSDEAAPGDDDPGPEAAAVADAESPGRRTPATERRRALVLVLSIWMDLTRDLALVGLGAARGLRDPGLLEELTEASNGISREALATFLGRLVRAGELLESNVAPELIADSLVLAWPRRSVAA
jgi:DNA polymerase III delta' subunit